MLQLFSVREQDDARSFPIRVGLFTSFEAVEAFIAQDPARRTWRPVKAFDTVEEFEQTTLNEERERALAKLSQRDRAVLGLID